MDEDNVDDDEHHEDAEDDDEEDEEDEDDNEDEPVRHWLLLPNPISGRKKVISGFNFFWRHHFKYF